MAADDPVDTEAMIFTEFDVYMIAGRLAGWWGVDRDDTEATEDIEEAIASVLADPLNSQRS